MALRHSVSFPRGTKVTYITWDVPLRDSSCIGNALGQRDVHVARLANPCLVWKSTAMAGEKRARSGSQIFVKSLTNVRGVDHPAALQYRKGLGMSEP